MNMENKIYKLSDNEFKTLIEESLNIKEVLFKLGYTTAGNSWGYSQIKQRMSELNITFDSFRSRINKTIPNTVVENKDLFKENCKHPRSVLRRRILKEGLLEYKCQCCGIYEWNGKPLALELDHINGINNDNRLENLRFLCPNCHSQTVTYGSKNGEYSKKERKDFDYDSINEELKNKIIEEYKNLKNYRKVAKKLGIVRSIVHGVIKSTGMLDVNQKFVICYDENYNEIKRYGCLAEAARDLINTNKVRTKKYKTCRATLLRNINKFWLGYYWKLMDA